MHPLYLVLVHETAQLLLDQDFHSLSPNLHRRPIYPNLYPNFLSLTPVWLPGSMTPLRNRIQYGELPLLITGPVSIAKIIFPTIANTPKINTPVTVMLIFAKILEKEIHCPHLPKMFLNALLM